MKGGVQVGKKATKALITAMAGILTNKKVKKTILGEYSDGTTRSFADAVTGEIISPEDKERYLFKKRRKKKKKKKHKIKL